MNDRDRLAADLDDVTMSGRTDAEWLADRLIALGWTRLDEDRLARALDQIDMADWWEEYPIVEGGIEVARETEINTDKAAAAIAKAYREDSDG